VTSITVPPAPVYPLGEPPLKETIPAVFEKAGSEVQRLKIELVRDTDTTDNSRGLKDKVPSAALTAFPEVLTTTDTVKVLPVLYTPVAGLTDKVDAKLYCGTRSIISAVVKKHRTRSCVLREIFATVKECVKCIGL